MASPTNFLITHFQLTEEDCKREISDTDIVKIARSLHGKWKTQLPPILGLESTVVTDIVGAPEYITEEDRRIAFFKEWKQQNGFDTTYEILISALLEVECRQDAESVCKILKETTLHQTSISVNTTGMPSLPASTTPGAQKQMSTPTSSSPARKQTATASTNTMPCTATTSFSSVTRYRRSTNNAATPDEAAIREALQQQLNRNIKVLLEQYAEYVMYIRDAVVEKEVSIQNMLRHLLYLPALRYHSDVEEHKLLHGKREKLKQMEEVKDIFLLLYEECTSFLNYEIFHSIANTFGVDECDRLKYPEYLEAFVKKHTISEFAKINPMFDDMCDPSKRSVICKLDIKKTERFSKISDLRHCIAENLDVDSLCLEIIEINDGCVEVTFLFPAHILDAIFARDQVFTPMQVERLRAMKIIFLRCGDKYLLDLRNQSEKVNSEPSDSSTAAQKPALEATNTTV